MLGLVRYVMLVFVDISKGKIMGVMFGGDYDDGGL